MTVRSGRFFCFICLALSAALVSSCGRKTEPLTPDSPRPEAVKNIKAAVRDNIAYLSWPIPAKNIEGRELDPAEIKSFRIYRAEAERGRKRLRYKLLAEIEMSNPAPAEVRNGAVFWSDRNLRYGQGYRYRIRALSARGGVSPLSEEVWVTPILSLAPPRNLMAEGKDGNAVLSWDPVTTRSDGSRYDGFVGYNIYRRLEKGRYEDAPLNKEPLRTNSYKDTAVVNGTAYFYMVRAVDSPALPWKESLDSSEATATPRDLTPPVRPTGLTVVPGVGRVFLTWNENKERDLAGYFVYRTTKSGKAYERLTEKLINRTTFSDETVTPGTTYYYVVTAVDQAGNESPTSKEGKAYVEKKR